MSTEDLYGLRTDDLEAARVVAERVLGVTLEPRNSSYYGGDYYRKRSDNADDVILQINNDGEADGWAEPDYREFGVLLRVFSPADGDRYKKALTCPHCGFIPLERSVTSPLRVVRMRYTDGEEQIYFEKQLDHA
jgi:hypothetical protein